MRIITGSTGTTHVTSNDDGEFNQGIFGTGLVVLPNGKQLAATILDNNTIQIADGDLILQGRHALIEPNATEDINIETGAVDVNRNDLIVARYELDTTTGYESIILDVIKGTETSGEASDPEYVTGDIRTGAALVEVPLYRVCIESVVIKTIEPLFEVTEDLLDLINKTKGETVSGVELVQTYAHMQELYMPEAQISTELSIKKENGTEEKYDITHKHGSDDITVIGRNFDTTFSGVITEFVGGKKSTLTVMLNSIGNAIDAIITKIVSLVTRITTLETDNVDGGTIVFAYTALDSGAKEVTDTTNDWNKFKGFVLGVELTGGDGTQYTDTKYIPKNYLKLASQHSIKQIIGVWFSSTYTFNGVATFNFENQTAKFNTTGFTGFKSPKWFLYGVK